MDDLIGLSGFYPKFVKRYLNLNKIISNAIKKYKTEVIKKNFLKFQTHIDKWKLRIHKIHY